MAAVPVMGRGEEVVSPCRLHGSSASWLRGRLGLRRSTTGSSSGTCTAGFELTATDPRRGEEPPVPRPLGALACRRERSSRHGHLFSKCCHYLKDKEARYSLELATVTDLRQGLRRPRSLGVLPPLHSLFPSVCHRERSPPDLQTRCPRSRTAGRKSDWAATALRECFFKGRRYSDHSMELLVHQGEHGPLEGVRGPEAHLQILPLPKGEGNETGCTCMQSQIVCHRCQRVLAYPSGAPSVCGAMC
ncbi:uncharacterized protein LOC119292865 [Triticum dicoccoides]|uniref:uncharacterized protein LOC119292865 n=1 Tax=Triticum dicoccoides TaxID=85692 RepID=UPI00188E5691|nr:uncharacterized protein LOC119292865 [Triticum dicoccoides]